MLIQKELEIVVEGKGIYNITDIINQAISKQYQKVSVLYLSNILQLL